MKPPVDGAVKSVKRALDLVELLAAHPEPLSFLDLVQRLGVPKSSLFHLMGHLIARGYVEQAANPPRYRLGRMLGILASKGAKPEWLSQIVQPLMHELSAQTNEFTAFYIPEGNMVRGVVVADGGHALSYRIAPEHLVPLHAFSAGKVVLAHFDAAAFEHYLAGSPRQRFTAGTVVEAAALRKAIVDVRNSGIGLSRSEYSIGVAGFAMGVRAGDRLAGVINVSVPEPRVTETHQAEVLRSLATIAAKLQRRLDEISLDVPAR